MDLVATVTLRSTAETGVILYNAVARLSDGQIELAGRLRVGMPRRARLRALPAGVRERDHRHALPGPVTGRRSPEAGQGSPIHG